MEEEEAICKKMYHYSREDYPLCTVSNPYRGSIFLFREIAEYELVSHHEYESKEEQGWFGSTWLETPEELMGYLHGLKNS